MLQCFAMATYMLSSFFWCFASVSDVCWKSFSCFRRMLQVFHLNVAKVDRMLHMLNGTHMPQLSAAAARAPPSGRSRVVRRRGPLPGRAKRAGAENGVQGNGPAGVGVRTRA
jgi:hypothetical protein